jgi:hypothetical protein
MIVRLSRARLRRGRERGAFEFLRPAASAGQRPVGMEAMFIGRWTGTEADELVAITYEDLTTLGLDPEVAP